MTKLTDYSEEEQKQLKAFVRHCCDLAFPTELEGAMVAPVVLAQIDVHCGWDFDYVNERSGAVGCSQLLPKTCEWLAARNPDLGGCAPERFEWAIPAMIRYDAWLHSKFPYSDRANRYAFMLSAYNGALKWMYKDRKLAIDRDRNPNKWFDHVELCSERTKWAIGVNRQYVRDVLNLAKSYGYDYEELPTRSSSDTLD